MPSQHMPDYDDEADVTVVSTLLHALLHASLNDCIRQRPLSFRGCKLLGAIGTKLECMFTPCMLECLYRSVMTDALAGFGYFRWLALNRSGPTPVVMFL